jgi:hypothetical protein
VTIISLPVESIRAHDRLMVDLAREWGIAEGRAQMALEHGIPDLELMRDNALYHATVTAVFWWLAYGSPLAIAARRVSRR